MSEQFKSPLAFSVMALMLILGGIFQSWSLSLAIFNLCLISAIMALGINIQWGYAGLLNVGVMGFTALGGLSAVLISQNPVKEAWIVGGFGMLISLIVIIFLIIIIVMIRKYIKRIIFQRLLIVISIILAIIFLNQYYHPAVKAIE